MNSNNLKYCASTSIVSFTLLFTSGGLLQTLFSELGFSLSQIATYTSVVGTAQIVMMVVNIFFADSIKDILKWMTFLNLSPVISCAVFLFFCLFPKTPVNILFAVALFVCTLQNILMGIHNILYYRIPYILIEMSNYATISNTISIITSSASIGVSLLVTFLSDFLDYKIIMFAGFLVCIILSVTASVLLHKCIPLEQSEKKKNISQKGLFSKIFKKKYIFFYCPNFLRGILMGVMGVISVVFIKNVSKSPTYLSALVPVLSFSTILGSIIYQKIKMFLSTEMLYFLSSVVLFLFFPLLSFCKLPVLFFVVYAIVGIAYQIVNQAAAVHPAEFIPFDEIGSFTAIRLIVLTISTAVSSYIVGQIIETVSIFIILFVSAIVQLISGFFFFYWDKKVRKKISNV